MNILVCLKYISSIPEYAESRLPFSPNDLNALAMAASLKMRDKNSKLIVISMSPLSSKSHIQDLYSYGVDSVYLVSDKSFAESDTLATTFVLSTAIKKIMESIKIDLILCGDKSVDSNTGQVTAGLSYRLDALYCNCLEEVVFNDNKFEFISEWYTIKNNEGLVVADVSKEFELPFPSLQNILRARESKVVHWSNEHLGMDLSKVGLSGSPTKIIKVQRVNAQISDDLIQENIDQAKLFLKQLINTRGGVDGAQD
jgi:electron transfer flavoprotein beta subunit